MQPDIVKDKSAAIRNEEYRLFETTDLDEARESVASVYCDHHLTSTTGDVDAFHYHMPFDGISFNYMQYGVESVIEPGRLDDFYLLQLPVMGNAIIELDGEVIQSDATTASVVNPSAYTRMTWSEHCKQFMVQISKSKVEEIASSCLGVPTNSPPVFENVMLNRNPAHAAWWRHAFHFINEYSQDSSFYHNADILSNELDNIVRGLLHSLQNDYSERLVNERPSVLPRHVKLAIDYICEHSSEDISVDTLVTLTGVSERSLFEGFKKFKSTSPMRFLLKTRLESVRADLMDPSRGDRSITEIASERGFNQLGRFSAMYKKVYGELPSETQAQRREF
ncbi:MAG: AraC family transcriptional regulator [Halioglobus sp.]